MSTLVFNSALLMNVMSYSAFVVVVVVLVVAIAFVCLVIEFVFTCGISVVRFELDDPWWPYTTRLVAVQE